MITGSTLRLFMGFAIAACAIAMASACGKQEPGPPPEGSVLELAGTPGRQCLPWGRHDYTFGIDAVYNRGSDPVRVLGAHLNGALDIQLVAAYILPIQNMTLVGASSGWVVPGGAGQYLVRDPDASGPGEPEGVIVRSAAVDAPANVVLHLSAARAPAKFDSFSLIYSYNGSVYTATNSTSLEIHDTCG